MAKGHKRKREEEFRKTGDPSLLRPGDLGYDEAMAAEELADKLLEQEEDFDEDEDEDDYWRNDPNVAKYLVLNVKK
jgi:hypothetical protein